MAGAEVTAAVTIQRCARLLGVSVRSVQRDVRDGAPVVRRGGRGRGRVTLVDAEAIRAWRGLISGKIFSTIPDDRLLVLAADVPNVIADAMHEAFIATEGPHKRAVAGALAGAGYLAIVGVLDRIRGDAPRVPELTTLPQKIEQLRLIFGDSGKLVPSSMLRE